MAGLPCLLRCANFQAHHYIHQPRCSPNPMDCRFWWRLLHLGAIDETIGYWLLSLITGPSLLPGGYQDRTESSNLMIQTGYFWPSTLILKLSVPLPTPHPTELESFN